MGEDVFVMDLVLSVINADGNDQLNVLQTPEYKILQSFINPI